MSTASTPTVDAVTRKLGATRLKKVSTTNGKKELMKVSKVFRRTRIDDGGGGGDGYPAGAVGGGPVMKDYGKVRASFQCENEDCRKKWSSAHAWSTRLDQYCEGCESKAKVARLENEMLWIETFRCNGYHGPDGGEHRWESLTEHSDVNPCPPMTQDCDICGNSVTSGGAQYRFGRHYWYQCGNPDCGLEWEDAQTGTEYTQHCTACRGRGTKLGLRRETVQEQQARSSGYGGGGHSTFACDMCMKLQRDGVARSCIRKNRVVMERTIDNGDVLDRILRTEEDS